MKALRRRKPCLVVREQRSDEISSRSLGYLVNPGNADERKEVVQASRPLVQPDSNSKIGYSQASRQENVLQTTRKLVQEDQNQTESDERKYSNSTSSRKLAASSPQFKHMDNTNHQYMSQIFQCLWKKLGISATNAAFSIDMVNVYDFVDESRHPLWVALCVEYGNLEEHKIRGY